MAQIQSKEYDNKLAYLFNKKIKVKRFKPRILVVRKIGGSRQ